MKKLFCDLLTGVDKQTFDPSRVVLAMSSLTMIGRGVGATVPGVRNLSPLAPAPAACSRVTGRSCFFGGEHPIRLCEFE